MNKYFLCILLLIVNCIVSACSQVMLKKAAQKEYPSFLRQYFNIRVILAYSLFFLVVIGNTFVLKYIPMTIMGPISETLPYILSILFGYFVFNEKITKRKILGAVTIVSGIVVLVI
ncbi:MAG: EamA family transporter [Spirochaetaceae bacterium]|nr:EamA family transporter [Spirochaetaceae bacterium]